MDISWWNPIQYQEVRSIIDLTLDSGRSIQLIEWSSITVRSNTADHDILVQQHKDNARKANAICRNLPTICYNCHGLSFATRRGWLNDVSTVLSEESYRKLEMGEDELISGDIIAYYKRNRDGLRINHTGIVCVDASRAINDYLDSGNDYTIKVVSKWGALGEYLHFYDKNPYYIDDTLVEFFRYQRTKYK